MIDGVFVTHYYLKIAEQPGDVFGPMAVTVVHGMNGPKYLEYRMAGNRIKETWLMPVWMIAE